MPVRGCNSIGTDTARRFTYARNNHYITFPNNANLSYDNAVTFPLVLRYRISDYY